MNRRFTACAGVLLMGACSEGPTSPIADGYTLHGVVTAPDGTPLRDVSVLLAQEGSSEFRPFATTGDDGAPVPACAADGTQHRTLSVREAGVRGTGGARPAATRLETFGIVWPSSWSPSPNPLHDLVKLHA